MRGNEPALVFLIVLVIGIVAGLLFDRFLGPSWFVRQFAGTRAIVTSALVGIAGAFIGFHIATLLALGGGVIVLYIAAVIGAAVVLYVWRMIR
jgi:uncharacterized membrane protein YeaQ/YmgE (transglycosylase-associated protein family)